MPLRLLPYRNPQPHYHLLCCHRTRTTFTSCQQEARGGRSWEKVTERGKLRGLMGTARQPPQRQRHCFHTLAIFWQDTRFGSLYLFLVHVDSVFTATNKYQVVLGVAKCKNYYLLSSAKILLNTIGNTLSQFIHHQHKEAA